MRERGVSTSVAVVIAVIITGIVVGSSVYVLTPKEEITRGEKQVPTIEFMATWTGGEENSFREVLQYAKQETGFDYKYVPVTTQALRTTTLMAYESGTAPADIVSMGWPGRIKSDGNKGHLAPLGDLWDPNNFTAREDIISTNGKVWAAPFKTDVKPGFWYRKSFFEDHGLEEPDTYQKFLDLCETISNIEGVDAPIAAGDGDGWPLSEMTEAWIMRQKNGAQLQVDLTTGDADFTDQRIKDAILEIKNLLDKGYFSTLRGFGTQYEYFWDNKLPLYFMGSWTPSMKAVKRPEDLGVFKLPGVNGLVGRNNWQVIPSYSKQKEAAKEFLSAIISAQGQRKWAVQGGFIASNKGVSADAYQYSIMREVAGLGEGVRVVPDLDDTLGDPFQTAFWSNLKGLWTNPAGTDIDQMLGTLDEKQDTALED